MNYFEIAGEADAVVWIKYDGSSGVVRESDADWNDYLQWLAAGNQLAALTPADSRTLEQLRANALLLIAVAAQQAVEPATRAYPRAEIDSWTQQYTEASAWLGDSTTPAPLIDAICGPVRALQKQKFCETVVTKACVYRTALAAVIAWRRSITAWVENQNDRELLIHFTPRFPEVPLASQ